MIGTSVLFILLLSSCFSHFSSTLVLTASNYYGFTFASSSNAFWVCSHTTFNQYKRESITLPGTDRSTTMQIAVLAILKALSGASRRPPRIRPPPTNKIKLYLLDNNISLMLITQFVDIDFLFFFFLDPGSISVVKGSSFLHFFLHRFIQKFSY